jgi:hypothetical protein
VLEVDLQRLQLVEQLSTDPFAVLKGAARQVGVLFYEWNYSCPLLVYARHVLFQFAMLSLAGLIGRVKAEIAELTQ